MTTVASSRATTTEWIDRVLLDELEVGLERDRCALLIGPYEVGKSSLANILAARFGAGARLLNANLEEDRAEMAGRGGLLLNNADQLLVIDEIHGFPEGLDLIRSALETSVQRRLAAGRYLLLGSDPIAAQRLVSERLGTHAPHHRLSPIGLEELTYVEATESIAFRSGQIEATSPIMKPNGAIDMNRLWLRGGFPRSLLADHEAASFAYRERYITALCSRSYAFINPSLAAASLRELLTRIAINQGEPFKIDNGRRDQKALLDHLEDLGLVRQLRPWFVNHQKRLDKSPKVYLRDSGLLHALLGRRTLGELRGDAVLHGHSWEGFCLENLLQAAPGCEAFFYRPDGGEHEIDLLLDLPGGTRLAIEIKAPSSKIGAGFHDAIKAVSASEAFVIRPVPESSQKLGYREMTLSDMLAIVRSYIR